MNITDFPDRPIDPPEGSVDTECQAFQQMYKERLMEAADEVLDNQDTVLEMLLDGGTPADKYFKEAILLFYFNTGTGEELNRLWRRIRVNLYKHVMADEDLQRKVEDEIVAEWTQTEENT